MLYCCIARLQPVVGVIYSALLLATHAHAAIDSLGLSGVHRWTVTGAQLKRKEVESFELQQLDCVECKMHQCTVMLKDKIVINDAIMASNSDRLGKHQA